MAGGILTPKTAICTHKLKTHIYSLDFWTFRKMGYTLYRDIRTNLWVSEQLPEIIVLSF